MDVKAFSLVFCLHAVRSYASEPSCPDATFGREIFEQTLETKTILKVLQQQIASINDKLSKNSVSFNKWMQIDDIKLNLTVLYNKVDRMEHRLDIFEIKLKKDRPENPAFCVVLARKRIHLEGYETIIKFDTEISNIGGHYNKLTSQFTVPMDGVYMFSASILSDTNEEIWGYIKAGDKLYVSTVVGRTAGMNKGVRQWLLPYGAVTT